MNILCKNRSAMGFEVPMAVKITVYLGMMSCGLVDIYEYLGGTCGFHLQGKKVLSVLFYEDGGSRILQNYEYLPDHMKLCLRTPCSV
jgi:hypothetical protein